MAKSEAGIELAVVVLVVARVVLPILHSQAGTLWREAAGVVILTGVALFADFQGRKQLLDHLKPRSSMSSGILLGAVTVPTVLAARLLQHQRSSSSTEISQFATDRMKFEFWLAVACSTSMLLYLVSFLWKQKPSRWWLSSILESSCTTVLVLTTFWRMSSVGATDGAVWAAVYIVGGKILFTRVLETFPHTGTVGEVMLAVQGIVLYAANAVGTLAADSDKEADQAVVDALLQGLILGLLAMPVVLTRLHFRLPSVFGRLDDHRIPEKQSRIDMYMNHRARSFYLLLLVVVLAAVPLWVGVVTGHVLNPVTWTLRFVWRRPVPRLILCCYWIVIICSPLPHLHRISHQKLVPKILIRKYYHVMIVFMFIPALLSDARFLQLAFGIAFAIFLVVEMIRIGKLPPCGHLIERFMVAFTDHRDSGSLIISHFSLLLGCALPVWLHAGAGDRPLAAYAGILSLGVMDTFASVVGFNFGSTRVSPNSKKTVEGTLAGIGSMLVSVFALIVVLPSSARPAGVDGYLSLVAAVTGAGILEAYTLQLDNAFIPLLFYAMLCL